MTDEQVLKAAIDHINAAYPDEKPVTVDDIMSNHIGLSDVSLVVDRGVKGGPKYIIPLGDLEPLTEAKLSPAKKQPARRRSARSKK
jgi:hypothetical protein